MREPSMVGSSHAVLERLVMGLILFIGIGRAFRLPRNGESSSHQRVEAPVCLFRRGRRISVDRMTSAGRLVGAAIWHAGRVGLGAAPAGLA